MRPEALRTRTFADLEARGFRPAASLPLPDATAPLRPAAQVLARFVESTLDTMLAGTSPRSPDEVISMEYRFYCAHNAVVSARMGSDTVPEGFDAAVDGAAIEERRRSLTWCLSPDIEWDETDLST